MAIRTFIVEGCKRGETFSREITIRAESAFDLFDRCMRSRFTTVEGISQKWSRGETRTLATIPPVAYSLDSLEEACGKAWETFDEARASLLASNMANRLAGKGR